MPYRKKSENSAPVETDTETVTVKKKKYEADDVIPCRSITPGGLYMVGAKTKTTYEWADIGDITEVEYQDIIAAVRSNSRYLYAPYFLIEDDELVAQLPQIEKLYQTMYTKGELSEVITDLSPADMEQTIKSLPTGAQEAIKTLAAQMIRDGRLDSIRKIKILESMFDLKFSYLSAD